jgi:hypothetical protein
MGQQNKNPENLRAHPRYITETFDSVRVFLSDSKAYPIRDISYAGFSIGSSISRIANAEATIEVLGKSIQVFVKLVHAGAHSAGFAFEHRGVETLIFLQPFIERLRVGSSLEVLAKDVLSDKYLGQEFINLRGDGPTDLVLKLKSPGSTEIDSLLMTFRDSAEYYEFRFRGDQIHTGRQLDSTGISARMAETPKLDLSILRTAAATIMGVQDQSVQQVLRPVFQAIVKHLH